MKIVPRIIWWIVYVVTALVLQRAVPGLDALAPGFLLALQQRSRRQIFCLFLLFTLIQEGTGSLHFGMGMLWYGGQIALFHLGSRLFMAENFLFVSVLSLGLGVYYCVLLWLMCALLDTPVEYINLIHQGLLQAVITPVIWSLAGMFVPKAAQNAH